MRAYFIRRLLLIIPTLLILSIIVFLLVRFIPGDVIDAMQQEFTFTAGERSTVKVSSARSDWTCPFTCNTGAG